MSLVRWQEAAYGGHVDFVVKVAFHEGPSPLRDSRARLKPETLIVPSADLEWEIFKRYRVFDELAEALEPYLRDLGLTAD